MIEVGVIGGTGYTAGELIRLMINHPKVNINTVISRSSFGKNINLIHKDLLGDIDLKFSKDLNVYVDVLFFCLGHGKSKKELKNIPKNIKIIDLSEDFRITEIFEKRHFIYGLPELNKKYIKESKNIANPGCFSTAILLSILPLAKKKLLNNNIHISAITGSTGSGKKCTNTNNFSWRNNNISTYKIFQHQHLKEIEKNIIKLQKNFYSKIYFIPYRGNFSRGIISTMYTNSIFSLEENKKIYKEYYYNHPFVKISDFDIDLKQVINTNKCILYLRKEKNKLIVVSIIDNLIKGASGQAIQNMNLMFNIDETYGLKNLKSICF